MRLFHGLLLSSLLVLTVSCSASEGISRLTPTTDTTSGLYQPDSQVEAKFDAIAVGNKLLEEKGGIQWTTGPKAVIAEELSYAEAVQRVGIGEGEYNLWPHETRVWLVIFKGIWLLTPLDPNQANPAPLSYEGCLIIVFTARDGELISMGDATCPAN